jgi:HEAT repeat protein
MPCHRLAAAMTVLLMSEVGCDSHPPLAPSSENRPVTVSGRVLAVEAIGIHPEGNRLHDTLCRLLSDADGLVVRSACEAAAVKRVTAAHDSILRLIDAEEESTRIVSLHALRALWQESDFERVFRAFSSDGSTAVRKEAAWTLRSNASPSTWRRLFEVWRASSLPRYREWACELASAYGSSNVLPDLRRLVNDTDGHVRKRAAQAVRDVKTRGVTEGA